MREALQREIGGRWGVVMVRNNNAILRKVSPLEIQQSCSDQLECPGAEGARSARYVLPNRETFSFGLRAVIEGCWRLVHQRVQSGRLISYSLFARFASKFVKFASVP